MTAVLHLHRRWSKRPKYTAAYKALRKEFEVAQALIEARTRVGLSQTTRATRIKTS